MNRTGLSGKCVAQPWMVLLQGRIVGPQSTQRKKADALALPRRDLRLWLQAAGFATPGTALHDAPMSSAARHVFETLLAHQHPYSAAVIDRDWNILLANAAFEHAIEGLVSPKLRDPARRNMLTTLFSEDALLPYLLNGPVVAAAIRYRVFREAVIAGGPTRAQDHLENLLLAAHLQPDEASLDTAAVPQIVPYHLRLGQHERKLFSISVSIGAPADPVYEEHRIETFLPWPDSLEVPTFNTR